MPTFTGAWDAARATAFLEDAVVPVRLACHRRDGSLWMLSLWFRYGDGAFHCATGADADVVGFLRGDGDVAFEVSTNDPPYMGVRGNGRATVDADRGKELLRDLMERYLGGTDNALGEQLLDPEREEVHIRIDPEELYTWDFSGRMPAADDS
jgi:nitroimidazol reductase NimA-like FMN-containing flavoprotein (pyridoxamine 5'-phosphate oxidase superfamily)